MRTKRTYILLIIGLLLALSPAFSQKHSVGLSGGLSVANIQTNNKIDNQSLSAEEIERNVILAYKGAIDYQHLIEENIIFGAGINFVQKGYKRLYRNNIIVISPILTKDIYVSFIDSYISLPLTIKYQKGDKLQRFIGVGICPAYMISKRTFFPKYNSDLEEEGLYISNHNYDDRKKIDFSIMLNLGLEYQIYPKLNFFIEAGYNQGLLNVNNSKTKYFRYNYNLSFIIGQRFFIN